MPSRFLIRGPGRQGFLLKVLSGFLALDVLRYRFAHNPMRGTLTQTRQMLNAVFQVVINLDRSGHSRTLVI
jgi:hypothetical protein